MFSYRNKTKAKELFEKVVWGLEKVSKEEIRQGSGRHSLITQTKALRWLDFLKKHGKFSL